MEEIIRQEQKMCPYCMKVHEIDTVKIMDSTTFKGEPIEYLATYEHCSITNEYYQTEEQMDQSFVEMKDAYRKKIGRLTTEEICKIRQKYSISQTDLAILLGWGEKTIARYEGQQVQDAAHDSILRKLDHDPEWFLQLLQSKKTCFSNETYDKYYNQADRLFKGSYDSYLQKSLLARYATMNGDENSCGSSPLNIGKIIDVIRYIASSHKVPNLYKVRLWKMLWYSDSLSYKRHGHSITGLAYCALPMGAVPVGGELVLGLSDVEYTEVEFNESTGYHFTPIPGYVPQNLSVEDIEVLETVIDAVEGMETHDLVERMHQERGYREAESRGIIQYCYAKDLSLT